MTDNTVRVALCSESGCGLVVVDIGSDQYRMDMMPYEVVEALQKVDSLDELKAYLICIKPDFAAGIDAIGIEQVAATIKGTKLPPVIAAMQ